nr:unnamed protein product [Digitaria exilis]
MIALIRRCVVVKKKMKKIIIAKVLEEIEKKTKRETQACDALDDVVIDVGPVETFLKEILNEKPMRFSSEQLASCTRNYSSELGSGGYGVVYRGDLPNGLPVAVKVLKVSMNKKVQEAFMAEIGTIGRTYHVHLVRLYGFCFDMDTKALLWMALPATEKCDVYSFGMVLFEILGRRRNFDPCHGESKEWFPRWAWERYEQGEIDRVVSCCGDGMEKADREKAEMMCKVALWCVQFQPAARPTMSSVVRMLEGEMAIVPPVNPFHYVMDSSSSGSSSSALWSGSYQSSRDTTAGRNSELSVSPAAKSTDPIIEDVTRADAP